MELMQRQLDDDLDESENEVLMNHTRQCPDCAAMFERLKLLSAELTSLPKVMPSYSLVDAIMPQLERLELFAQSEATTEPANDLELREAAGRRMKRERRWPSMRIVGGVIAAGIVAGLFLVTYKPGVNWDLSTAEILSTASNNSAADMANEEPKGLAFKMPDSSNGASSSEVKTEAMNKDNKLYGISTDPKVRSSEAEESTQQYESSSIFDPPKFDASTGSESAVPEQQSDGSLDEKSIATDDFQGEQGFAAHNVSVMSPDELYDATVEMYKIRISTTSDQEIVYTSPRKNGELINLSWSEDSSQLTYEVHIEQGAIEKYVIDLATLTEQKAVH
ncbi:anti-sigma factor [Paenibacillus sp. FSL H8-0548]|nr:zf-HC2 domain-containing protein [Paenibacillus sp. FSL H8-0548]